MKEFKRCNRCVITNTRFNIKFNEEGICYPCLYFENQEFDESERWLELDDLCSKYRKRDGSYDMIIPLSGGKDSHYQVHLFKEMLNMNPLGIMVDYGSWTKVGRDNFYNIGNRFGIDILTFTINGKTLKREARRGFFDYLHPWKYWDKVLYEKPLELAQKLGIGLVAWGENTSITTGGKNAEETPNALCLVDDPDKYKDIKAIFTSYYVPWSRYKNVDYALENGFKGLSKWSREGLEGWDTEQVDTIGYLIQQYFKFIKFGFSNQTELCSDAIRHGVMTRDEALKMVYFYDWKFDSYMVEDFCNYLDIDEKEFWETVDKFANRDLLEKQEGVWRLKDGL
jgi:tRNA(Ile)-lysidine synthase TilS/MesJ